MRYNKLGSGCSNAECMNELFDLYQIKPSLQFCEPSKGDLSGGIKWTSQRQKGAGQTNINVQYNVVKG